MNNQKELEMSNPVYIILDTETTGLNTNIAGIISFSYIITDLVNEIERGTIEMNPFESEVDIANAAEAMKVNGYTAEQVLQFMPAKEGMKQIAKVFERATVYGGGSWPKIMGYNVIGYDMPIIVNNCKKYGVYLPKYYPNAVDVMAIVIGLDTMGLMPTKTYPDGKKMGNKLCENVEKFGIESDPSKFHASMYDVEMTLAVFNAIKNKLTSNEGGTNEDIGCERLQ